MPTAPNNPRGSSGFCEHPAQVAGLLCFGENLSWMSSVASLLTKWPCTLTDCLMCLRYQQAILQPAAKAQTGPRRGQAVKHSPRSLCWCSQWDLDRWAGRLSTAFEWRTVLPFPIRKCHVSDLQREAPAFPVGLMIKAKQQKGTEEGKQLSGFEECEWGLSERRHTDSTQGCIPCVTISAGFPSCSKPQLWTRLPACDENTCVNSRCKEGELELLFIISHMICQKGMYFQTIEHM